MGIQQRTPSPHPCLAHRSFNISYPFPSFNVRDLHTVRLERRWSSLLAQWLSPPASSSRWTTVSLPIWLVLCKTCRLEADAEAGEGRWPCWWRIFWVSTMLAIGERHHKFLRSPVTYDRCISLCCRHGPAHPAMAAKLAQARVVCLLCFPYLTHSQRLARGADGCRDC